MPDKKIKVGTKIQATPIPEPEIGVDTKDTFQQNVINATQTSSLDVTKISSFLNVSQTRDNIYSTIDSMSQDSTLAAVLETYAEDSVEPNDKGQLMWCESTNEDINKYVTYLLKSLNINKNLYSWTYKLIKYGDLYLRLYRKSDYDYDEVFKKGYEEEDKEKEPLNEELKLKLYSQNDHYVHYIEAVPNPSEIFELTKFGKTMGYIKAPVGAQNTAFNSSNSFNNYNMLTYRVKKRDIEIYSPTDFVHAYLEDTSSRVPEEVNIFLDNNVEDLDNTTDNKVATYTVRRGESLFNDVFKIWRELSLLENSVLLSRLTKSSIVRVLNVDVGDMPKEQVASFMERLKTKIEQKSALDTGKSMQEYTNPGPIENIIYVPTHGTQGTITAQTLGGDVDPKQLTDLSYFQDKLFAALRVPKQFFGVTDDSTGFNGGSSLSIISSRYGKSIKRIQNTLCQAITDVINLFLLDKGLKSYVNKFTLRMQAPITQDEIDKRENKDNRIRYVGDIMSQLEIIDDNAAKLKILKSLMAEVINDPDVMQTIQDQIDKIEKQEKEENAPVEEKSTKHSSEPMEPIDNSFPESEPAEEPLNDLENNNTEETTNPTETTSTSTPSETTKGSYMPNPSDLNIDMTVNK